MAFDGLKTLNTLQADKELEATRHQEDIAHTDFVADTVLSATSSLIKYLEGHTSLVEVTNQIESISTPDVKFVVEALQVLDRTLQERPTTDLSEVTALMRQLVAETEAIPKSLPELPTPDKPIDYSEQLTGLSDAIKAVEKVVREQKLVAEAPVVNVPKAKVHVDAPDLKPIETGLDNLLKATKKGPEKVIKTQEMSGLLNQPYDEYKLLYTVPFDDEEKRLKATDYYLDGKKAFSIKYSYDKEGTLLGGKRV